MSSQSKAVQTLSVSLPSKVSFPGDPAYKATEHAYYVFHEEVLEPTCIVSPATAEDVCETVKILKSHGAKFAIRGGGHNLNAGWANIQNGITINLRTLNGVALNADKTVASIGGGATWKEVYQALDTQDVVAPGGRVAGVGVGGLSTGGGISYFSAKYGLVCDNIVNFQVVLASGEIVDANEHENRDLWVALRGGSSNFGIVTRFDMRTFPGRDFFGGFIVYDISTIEEQLKALVNLGENLDPSMAIVVTPCYVPANNGFIVFTNFVYTEKDSKPAAMTPFLDLQPQMMNTSRLSRLADFTTETEAFEPKGKRATYCTATFKSDLKFLKLVYSMFRDSTEELKHVPGFSRTLSLQLLPPEYSANTKKLGGNSLGLKPEEGPMILLLMSYVWDNDDDTNFLEAAAKKFINSVDEAAREHGTYSQFKYLNYAASWQDPFSGYGNDNMSRLHEVSRKYDPERIFQELCPGGFKIGY